MNPLLMSLLLIVALAVFAYSMYFKIALLRALQPADRVNQIMERIKSVLVLAIGQKRLIGRKKDRASGIMHAFIFWGFLVLLIHSIHLYGNGFVQGFHLPFFGSDYLLGYAYILLKDIMVAIVLVMVILAVYRRAVIKPERMHNTWEAYLILGLIGFLMISELLYNGARYNFITLHDNPANLHFFDNPTYGFEFLWTPVSVGTASLISGLSAKATYYLLASMFWLHVTAQLVFLNLLPHGKHFHVITALPNVFLKTLGYPHEKPELLDLENEEAWEDESLGINHIHQLNWKQGLDLYTCTECGRCKEVCPTYLTDKPLSLHELNDKLKAELFANADNIIKRSKLAKGIDQDIDQQTAERIKDQMAELGSSKQLVDDVVGYDTLWACTTCRACEEVCPVTIEQVPRIISMRQGQFLMAESYPKELNTAFKGLERNGNPWGIGYDKRADWASGLDVPVMADNPDVDYLLWVGCAGSFDDRIKKVSTSLVKILQKAGISFAILGTEEKCTGDFARKAGNEMLYQMMAQENIETLNNYKVQRIITACPHCLNTLKHEYPQLGGNYEVMHHTQFISQLVQEGKIALNKDVAGSLTYHDPCYLGRYNSVYHEPRNLLQSVAGGQVKELDRHGQESFCCGAGGARMWMEETIGKRINIMRSEEIIAADVQNVAVGCPFCLTMIEDGMKDLDKDEELRTKDIAELVAENMV
ncbi:MAG: heterodisulfide reductase-related iron-sulfur binding cluster [Desulfovermiculus sp.]